jgi:FG-GAP-like repeat/FG-GAP repeat
MITVTGIGQKTSGLLFKNDDPNDSLEGLPNLSPPGRAVFLDDFPIWNATEINKLASTTFNGKQLKFAAIGSGFDPWLRIYDRPSSSPTLRQVFSDTNPTLRSNPKVVKSELTMGSPLYDFVIEANSSSSIFANGSAYYVEASAELNSTIYNLGNLSLGQTVVQDFVGWSDPRDQFTFTLTSRSRVDVSLRRQTGDGDLSFNGKVSEASGNSSESIPNQILDPGTYTITVDAAYGYISATSLTSRTLNEVNSGTSMNVASTYELAIDISRGKIPESDFNGDGKSDLVWRNYKTGQNAIWSMSGTTFIEGTFTTPVSDINWSLASTGDFNGDGKSDLVWRNYVTGENAIWIMNGTTLSQGVLTTPIRDLNWSIAATGDFNADGKSDLVWRNYKTGQNAIWLMNGTELSQGVFTTPVSDPNWSIGGAGDFNNDGKSDLVWRNYATGQNAIWLMNGTELSQGVLTTPVSDPNWQMAGTGDFNNDGNSDLIWRNGSAGKNAVWLMNGTNLSSGVSLNDISDPNWRISNAFAGNPNIFPGRR